ncbi:MAG: DUF1232 domain-containing protein [Deltaproteobacteria bacterium]|nr:DUF1232 domain-containing protein [Deltaproteobacteria bacterium]
MDEYDKHYSEESFWEKLKQYGIVIGRKGVEISLTLYYCLQDPDTPTRTKAIIAGALGYLIFPLDTIPDLLPAVGFSDDLGALALALAVVAIHVKDEHKNHAKETLSRWFGTDDDDPVRA